jgi:hypothetical protein
MALMQLKAVTLAVATVATVVTAGCGTTNTTTGQPTTAAGNAEITLPQPELPPTRLDERDPVKVLREGLFDALRQPMADTVAITGYHSQIAADGTNSKGSAYVFHPPSGPWERIPDSVVVWSPKKSAWVLSDRAETISVGPPSERGVPTLKAETASGTSYRTFSYKDLSGMPLSDGLEDGFAMGSQLPSSVLGGEFSPGARAYTVTETVEDPFYTIHSVKNAETNTDEPLKVYACGRPSPDCTAPATSLDMAAASGGQFTNFPGNVRIELGGDGKAVLRPVDTDAPLATLTYRKVSADGPPRIIMEATKPGDADKFSEVIGISLKNFAFFETDNHVVAGVAQPGDHSAEFFAGYNRIAINDLLTQWTPALIPVLP